jgi:hypothetical protein
MKPFAPLPLTIAFLIAGASAPAENLLQNGSFEDPPVKGKVRHTEGGDPKGQGPSSWATVTDGTDGTGRLSIGLTNQIARTGSQSLYVNFDKLTAQKQRVSIETGLIPVKPERNYRISFWGRVDRDRPLALDERRPQLWLDIEYLQADGQTDAADSEHTVHLLPGKIVPGDITRPTFSSVRWTNAAVEIKTPPNTVSVRLTWTWMIGAGTGETDGAMYWDDATIEEFVPKEGQSPAPK